jgi:hypothetical protein
MNTIKFPFIVIFAVLFVLLVLMPLRIVHLVSGWLLERMDAL